MDLQNQLMKILLRDNYWGQFPSRARKHDFSHKTEETNPLKEVKRARRFLTIQGIKIVDFNEHQMIPLPGPFRKRSSRSGKGLAAAGLEPHDSGRQPAALLAANADPHNAALTFILHPSILNVDKATGSPLHGLRVGSEP